MDKKTVNFLFHIAAGLQSEHGENREYDRALCELIADAAGLTRDEVAERLRIDPSF
jgi:hypothetical protein